MQKGNRQKAKAKASCKRQKANAKAEAKTKTRPKGKAQARPKQKADAMANAKAEAKAMAKAMAKAKAKAAAEGKCEGKMHMAKGKSRCKGKGTMISFAIARSHFFEDFAEKRGSNFEGRLRNPEPSSNLLREFRRASKAKWVFTFNVFVFLFVKSALLSSSPEADYIVIK